MMAVKYENIVAFFADETYTPIDGKMLSSFFVLSTFYGSRQIRQLVFLKDSDHISTFKSVMKCFDVEMVGRFFK